MDKAAAELIGARPESLSNNSLDEVAAKLQDRVSNASEFKERCAMLLDGQANEMRIELQSPRQGLLRFAHMSMVRRSNGSAAERPIIGERQPIAEVEKMKSELISTVSHELRTPLTSIKESCRAAAPGTFRPTRANCWTSLEQHRPADCDHQ